jgi:hypothetical protein
MDLSLFKFLSYQTEFRLIAEILTENSGKIAGIPTIQAKFCQNSNGAYQHCMALKIY